jgi:hypothetical protein
MGRVTAATSTRTRIGPGPGRADSLERPSPSTSTHFASQRGNDSLLPRRHAHEGLLSYSRNFRLALLLRRRCDLHLRLVESLRCFVHRLYLPAIPLDFPLTVSRPAPASDPASSPCSPCQLPVPGVLPSHKGQGRRVVSHRRRAKVPSPFSVRFPCLCNPFVCMLARVLGDSS